MAITENGKTHILSVHKHKNIVSGNTIIERYPLILNLPYTIRPKHNKIKDAIKIYLLYLCYKKLCVK